MTCGRVRRSLVASFGSVKVYSITVVITLHFEVARMEFIEDHGQPGLQGSGVC